VCGCEGSHGLFPVGNTCGCGTGFLPGDSASTLPPDEIMHQDIVPLFDADIQEQLKKRFAYLSGDFQKPRRGRKEGQPVGQGLVPLGLMCPRVGGGSHFGLCSLLWASCGNGLHCPRCIVQLWPQESVAWLDLGPSLFCVAYNSIPQKG
jgi:hypothetical protein